MKLGLTGGIGCGKSTVVGLFREAGWATLSSDEIVRGILSSDASVLQALRQRWGDGVLAADGSVDRKAVAKRVFSSNEDLSWLESILHPLVRASWQSQVEAAPEKDWLIEIPLLFEKRLETLFDLTVCVMSPPDVVERRMVARGYTGAEITQRRERQMPLEKKAQLADHVISNAGSLEFLKRQTTRLIEQIAASESC